MEQKNQAFLASVVGGQDGPPLVPILIGGWAGSTLVRPCTYH